MGEGIASVVGVRCGSRCLRREAREVSRERKFPGFIYVARQVARAFFSFLWKASSHSPSRMNGGFASEVFGGARWRVGEVWGWISAFTGCPHLFAEGTRPRVDTRMECCFHANEHCDDHRRAPEPSSQTTPSGNTVNSDFKTPNRNRFGGGLFLRVGPKKGAALPTNAPGVGKELSAQSGSGLLTAGALGDAGENSSGVGIGADSHPGGLLEHPAQLRRSLLADVTMMGALPGF